ncbi:TcpQ domain-containing protein [Alteromonas oceanisediminis]|uniref:TcpQ domain-containing protein n=1 Tax=Alteromonas oceanisediminis TaxID=2836180 RepID=UPI001BD9C826|nr:TcpQ domain-containing protein [Alteromonas oceanisediminis]MBT0585651.1 TcpQ domain-containing protein [Alteromonas oceanisediminis]
MRNKKVSSSLFWARHLGLALALIVIAVIVVQVRQENVETPSPAGAPEKRSVASGLSAFYEEFRLSSVDPIRDEIGDFVMELSVSEKPLEERLQSMASDVRPVSGRWVGEKKYRTFKAGGTLRESLSTYAQQEGMQVIWDLDQDFVVKHQFQLDTTIAESVKQIASAINSNFQGDVRGYVCPQQRSLVLTTNNTRYLKDNCVVAR